MSLRQQRSGIKSQTSMDENAGRDKARRNAQRKLGTAFNSILERLESRTLLSTTLPAGSLDTSMGSAGLLTTTLTSGTLDSASAVTVDQNNTANAGDMVVAGVSSQNYAVAVYSPTGALIASSSPSIGVGQANAAAVTIDSSDRILVAGTVDDGSPNGNDFFLARYTLTGTTLTLDTTFGNVSGSSHTGYVTWDNGNASVHKQDIANAITIDNNLNGGDIIVVGESGPASGGATHDDVVAFTSSGTLDTAHFGNGTGRFLITTGSAQQANAVTVDSSGNILVAGQLGTSAQVLKVNPSGTSATSYTPNLGSNADIYAITVDGGGNYLVAGTADGNFVLADLNYGNATNLVSSFGTAGKTETAFNGQGAMAISLAIQPNGKIVLAGSAFDSTQSYEELALARYSANGMPDTAFGTSGSITYGFDTPASDGSTGAGVAIQADGKIVVVGQADNADNTPAVIASIVSTNAPVITDPTGGVFHSITENQGNATNYGDTTDFLLYGLQPTDADGYTPLGFAVTSVDNTHGVWQYTTNGGTTWTAFGSVSASSARVFLDSSSDRIRFVPNANFCTDQPGDPNNGAQPSISVVVWNGVGAANGSVVDTTVTNNTNNFGNTTSTLAMAVTGVNLAPVITIASGDGNQTVLENGANPSVLNVAGITITDPDAGNASLLVTLSVQDGYLTLAGYLPNGLAANNITGNGTNTITIRNASQQAIDTTLSAAAGLQYTPNLYTNNSIDGGPDTLSINVNDLGHWGAGGNQTAASSVNINITPVNQAPIRTDSSNSLNSVTSLLGQTVSLYLQGLQYQAGPTGAYNQYETGHSWTPETMWAIVTAVPSSLGTVYNGNTAVTVGGNLTLAQLGNLTFTAGNAVTPGNATFSFNIVNSGNTTNGGCNTLGQSKTINVQAVAAQTWVKPAGLWTDVTNPADDASPLQGDVVTADGVTVDGNGHLLQYGLTAFSDIQTAILYTQAGGTVHVLSGTFAANIIVNKAISIVGPNAAINGNATRNTEATIQPLSNGNISQTAFLIRSGNVSIQGLTIDGASDEDFSYAVYTDNFTGSFNNIAVGNNIIANIWSAGVVLYNTNPGGATTGSNVSGNLFNNIGTDPLLGGQGVAIDSIGYSGTISNNTITQSGNGIETGYNTPMIGNQTNAPTIAITGNHLYDFVANGVQDVAINAAGLALNSQINSNTIDTTGDSQTDIGIFVTDISDVHGSQLQVENNTVTTDGDDTALYISGRTYDVSSSTPVLASGNTFTQTGAAPLDKNDVAILISDDNSVSNTTAIISGNNTVSNYDNGIVVQDTTGNQVSATITGATITAAAGGNGIIVSGTDASAIIGNATLANTISGGNASTGVGITVTGNASANITNNLIGDNGTGIDFTAGGTGSVASNNFDSAQVNGTDLLIDSTAAGDVSIGDRNSFEGSIYINNQSSETFNLSGYGNTTFNGFNAATSAASGNLATYYAIEDQIIDYLDNSTLGYVSLKSGNVFVAHSSENPSAGGSADSIQRGVNVAPFEGTVYVQSGAFSGAVTVGNALTILGSGSGSTHISGAISVTGTGNIYNLSITNPGGTAIQIASGAIATIGSATLGNVSIASSSTGISVAGTATIANDTFTNDTTGIYVSGTAYITGNNSISGGITGIDVNAGGAFISGNNSVATGTTGIDIENGGYGNITGNNTITTSTTGILVSGNASIANIDGVTFTNNTTAIDVSGGTANITGNNSISGGVTGIDVSGGTAFISGNNSVATGTTGIDIENGGYANIAGNNTIANGTTGIIVSGNASSATIGGVTIANSTIGIDDEGGTLTFNNGISITGATTGLLINGNTSGITSDWLGNTSFSGETGNYTYITLGNAALGDPAGLNPTQINATAVSFDGDIDAVGTLAQNYAVEDHIADYLDNSTLGYVSLNNGNIFVAHSSETPSAGGSADSIQRGVNVAPGGTVYVQGGTFSGAVTVSKWLTILGSGSGSTNISGAISVAGTAGVNIYNLSITKPGGIAIQIAPGATAWIGNATLGNVSIASSSTGISVAGAATIANTTFTNNTTGIYVSGDAYITGNNSISGGVTGIDVISNGGAYITGNNSVATGTTGIDIENSGYASISGNNTITTGHYGIQVNGGALSLSGGSITYHTITFQGIHPNTAALTGILLSGNASSAIISGVTIANNAIGIDDEGGTLTFEDGISITGATTGLLINGNTSAITGDSLGNTSFSGETGNYTYITLGNAALGDPAGLNPTQIDATAVSFDGDIDAAGTLAQNYAVEDHITDYLDNSTLGYVKLENGNVFVTPTSESRQSGAIGRAENVAGISGTINVEGTLAFTPTTPTTSTYGGNISVSGSLSATGSSPTASFVLAGNVTVGVASYSPQVTTAITSGNFGSATLGTGVLNVGNYTLNYALADSRIVFDNYGTRTSALTVNKAALTVTADAQSKVYGASDPSLTYTPSGTLYNGDSYSVISGVSLGTATGSAATAGTHTITASGGVADNYLVSDVNGTLTVSKAALTVTTDAKSKVYGQSNPTFTGNLTGVQYSDGITINGFSTTATQYSDVRSGGYPISATLADPNDRLSNYTVVNNGNTLTITAATQTISWATPADIVYGTSLSNAQLNATVSGVGGNGAVGTLSYTGPIDSNYDIGNISVGSLLPGGLQETLTVTAAATLDYNSATATVKINVDQLQLIGSATINEGSTYTLNFGNLTLPSYDNVAEYIINWGDGNDSQVGNTSLTSFTHLYDQGGTVPDTILVTAVLGNPNPPVGQPNPLSDLGTLPITVLDVAPTGTLVNVFQTVSLGAKGQVQMWNAYDPSTVDTTEGFTYSWDYASNTSTDPITSSDYGNWTTPSSSSTENVPVSALSTPGTKYVWARIQDSNGGFTDYSTTIVVTDVVPHVNSIPGNSTINAGTVFTQAGSFTQPGSNGPFTGTVNYGDGTVLPLVINQGNNTFTLSHQYTTPGTDTVVISVTDDTGGTLGTGNTTLHIRVNDVAPRINLPGTTALGISGSLAQTGSISSVVTGVSYTATVDYNYVAGAGNNTFVNLPLTSGTFSLSNTYAQQGTYDVRVAVTDGNVTSTADETVIVPSSALAVTSITPVDRGLDLQFNQPINASQIHLYDGIDNGVAGSSTSDLTVTGPNGVLIRGSAVWDSTSDILHFVRTSYFNVGTGLWTVDNNPLVAGNYTVSLSGSDWVSAVNSSTLSNFSQTVAVAGTAAIYLSLPDVARGPGQSIATLANGTLGDGTTTAVGLPIALNYNGQNTLVTGVDFTLSYNPALLNVTNVTLDSSLSAGNWSVTYNNNTLTGVLTVALASNGPALSSASVVNLVNVIGNVPTTSNIYGAAGLLKVGNVRINETTAGAGDSAIQKVAYLGDTTGLGSDTVYAGNGSITGYSLDGLDASYIARVDVGTDTGFHADPLTDPLILGDVTGDGTLSALDASYVAEESVGLTVPQIPTPLAPPTSWAGVDPLVSIPTNYIGTRGQSVNAVVSIGNASGLMAADLNISYNAGVVSLNDGEVALDSYLSSKGWGYAVNVTNGLVRISAYDATPLTDTTTEPLVDMNYQVPGNDPAGYSNLNIIAGSQLNEGLLTLSPSNGNITVGIATTILDNPGNITYGTTVDQDAGNVSDVSLFGQASGNLSYQWAVTQNGIADATDSSNTSVLDFTPTAGNYSITLTVTDSANNQGTATETFTVGKATPTITWANPLAITYGTGLSSSQLDATSSWRVAGNLAGVAGNFSYTPGNGTVLNAGNQTLSVLFTPTDTTDYTDATKSVLLTVQPTTVANEYIFYFGSKFDKYGNTANVTTDFGAIAQNADGTDKSALLPTQKATFANFTSYTLGINGIMVDFNNLPAGTSLSASDFQFAVGNTNTPSSWTTAPAPWQVVTATDPNGLTAADIVWHSNAIQDTWLQVTVLPNADTGLAAPFVFYFGNDIGSIGNVSVTPANAVQVQNNFSTRAPISSIYDFNRDGAVNSADVVTVQNNENQRGVITLITPPSTSSSPAPQVASRLLAASTVSDAAVTTTATLAPATTVASGLASQVYATPMVFTSIAVPVASVQSVVPTAPATTPVGVKKNSVAGTKPVSAGIAGSKVVNNVKQATATFSASTPNGQTSPAKASVALFSDKPITASWLDSAETVTVLQGLDGDLAA